VRGDDRGQAYTIEGLIGAIVVASALVLGLQAVDIAPWADSSADDQTEALRAQAQDVLDAAADRDALRTAATCIDGDGDGNPHPAVAAGGRGNDTDRDTFGTLLNRTLEENGNEYNVYIEYQNGSKPSALNRTTISGNARTAVRSSVTVTRQVALFDTDPTYAFVPDAGRCVPTREATNRNNVTLAQRDWRGGDVYLEDQNESDELYAVVKIRVEVW